MRASPEFDVVERLRSLSGNDPSVIVGIGDDAAIIVPAEGHYLVTCVDTLTAGIHFPEDTAPSAIGHKALAVNLSDLAAMGARPRWAMLALSLADADPAWVAGFASGWSALTARYPVALIGGDTTRTPGPVSVTVQLMGELPAGQGVTRAGARPGDLIAVTGSLGGAALALQRISNGDELSPAQRRRLDCPEPRLEVGAALLPLATACIDLSDGLAADLPHVLADSGVGAEVDLARLPVHESLNALPPQQRLDLALSGGDDYELCFCMPPNGLAMINELLGPLDVPFTVIGEIKKPPGLSWTGQGDCVIAEGYGHFRD